jgi:hypothetical protein
MLSECSPMETQLRLLERFMDNGFEIQCMQFIFSFFSIREIYSTFLSSPLALFLHSFPVRIHIDLGNEETYILLVILVNQTQCKTI